MDLAPEAYLQADSMDPVALAPTLVEETSLQAMEPTFLLKVSLPLEVNLL